MKSLSIIKNNNKITLVAALKHHKLSYGTLKTGDDGVLLELEEKPEFTFKINTGVYVLEPDVLDHLQQNEYKDITDLITLVKNAGDRVEFFLLATNRGWILESGQNTLTLSKHYLMTIISVV